MLDPVKISICARAAYEANRAYCQTLGDNSLPAWDEAPEEAKAGTLRGAAFALNGGTARDQHEAWCADKIIHGWVWGPVKDPVAKTHPCLVAYEALPEHQRLKDEIHIAVVRALAQVLFP